MVWLGSTGFYYEYDTLHNADIAGSEKNII